MKGAVLVLALLVTVELHVQPAEACVIFYEIFSKLALGFEKPLYYALDKVHATEPEKAAFEKIQDCYNEGGIKAKTLDSMALVTPSLIPLLPFMCCI
ncbi:Androgen-binding protein like protein [Fukomys damarensis]|uniref:Androgen-binding protein like protein n=1 Tax=Fukomys damarensis TaxID=885580 RepID=A0A091DQ22_FUKDA|nr:Androgen-binding protein like protein [Fukomys damarensis]